MRMSYVWAGTQGLTASLILAACGQQFLSEPIGRIQAWIGPPESSVTAPAGTVNLTVRTKIAEPVRTVQALVPPYQSSDITRLRIELWKADGTSPEAYVDLFQSQLGSPVTFSSLSALTSYEIRATAFGIDDLNNEIQISDNWGSYTSVYVGTDTIVELLIRVKLGDSDFVGTGTSTITIIPGTYTDAASATITVATPTPAPEATSSPAPTPDPLSSPGA